MARTATGKKLVIVESPTKAKTIRKFLAKDYIVESCMGHVRDLPQSSKDIPAELKKEKWAQLGVNVEKDFDPLYCVPKTKTKLVSQLKALVKDADEILLATDEDREGESISWHLLEVLKPKVPVKRMVFNEITKDAILQSLKETREIDDNLVRAQEARRILDRLVGYTISPLLWKKVAYGLSAGRVQSVAVRLICEREQDRMKFKRTEYWGINGLCSKSGVDFETRFHTWDGKRVASGKDFDGLTGELPPKKAGEFVHLKGEMARSIAVGLKGKPLQVIAVEEGPVSRKPAAPFITSTLQQEASRKLGLSARDAMRVAQNLYEQGFITYMRTDSTFLSTQAIEGARKAIKKHFGADFLSPEPRVYTGKKVKGAQEAHEAIRPAGTEFPSPADTGLTGDQLRLYDMIWKRTLASQMPDAQLKQVTAKLKATATASAKGEAVFAASGLTITFPGFLRVYVEGQDDPDAALEEREVHLPPLKIGESVPVSEYQPTQHETKPPARFTEASLIQTLEKEGIGRPSTYAPTISTIMDRGYVMKMTNALAPTFTAMVVNKLLSQYFPQYVDLGFTSSMEKSLDDIAAGDLNSIQYLKSLYLGPKGLRTQVETQTEKIDPQEARSIQFSTLGVMDVRVGRYGAYVCRVDKETGEEVCASLPESQAPADITPDLANQLIDQKAHGADALGKHPTSGLSVYVLTGRYGPYVQLGESEVGESGEKPKRASLPAGVKLEDVNLELALDLLSLPKNLGAHPETGKDIKAGLGRFGPYVVHDGDFRSIPKGENLFAVTLTRALELLAQPKKGRGRAAPIRIIGAHPEDKAEIALYDGKYGHYVKWGDINASLPKDAKPEEFTLDQAVVILRERAAIEAEKKPSKAKKAKAAKPAKAKTAEPAKAEKQTVKKKAKVAAPPPPPIPKPIKASTLRAEQLQKANATSKKS